MSPDWPRERLVYSEGYVSPVRPLAVGSTVAACCAQSTSSAQQRLPDDCHPPTFGSLISRRSPAKVAWHAPSRCRFGETTPHRGFTVDVRSPLPVTRRTTGPSALEKRESPGRKPSRSRSSKPVMAVCSPPEFRGKVRAAGISNGRRRECRRGRTVIKSGGLAGGATSISAVIKPVLGFENTTVLKRSAGAVPFVRSRLCSNWFRRRA